MAGKLKGKVAFVTGAARGLGRSYAIRLAEEGADIIAVDLCEAVELVEYAPATREDLDETARLVKAVGRRIVSTVADVRSLEQMTAAVESGVSELGRLDIVVANAAISTYDDAATMSELMWRTVIDVNLTGVFLSIQPTIPHLIAAGGGSIIITSSAAGLKGMNNIVHYSAAKHGVVGLMRVLALELGTHHIRVNTVHPTLVDTPMIHHPKIYGLFGNADDTREEFAVGAEKLHVLPIPWVDPVDISNAVVFLASDDARYITATTLPVDAGTTQK
jgi:SDR family mycofactocin-dependent oxidoreductase